ncbi:MAG: hypothetical protein G01um10147_323 [Microgenomates group bacterium Gr01-1014_7]|nr:MAG: hypothetical protein G01um10147_323 [Microgenomates group bacterium Gr01-1014_7]
MLHETVYEQFQGALGEELRVKIGDKDTRGAKAIRGLMGHIARLHERGLLNLDRNSLPAPEQLVEVRRLHPDQRKGLVEAGFNFSMDALAVSVGELYADNTLRPLFGYVNDSEQMRAVVPVAREVAVNPDLNPDRRQAVFLPGSFNLSFDDQQGELDKFVQKLRKSNLKTGTLEGVDFAMDHASVLVQLDFESQRRGRKLIFGGWGRSIDETSVDPEFGPHLADVGRYFTDLQLHVPVLKARDGHPSVGIVPVASAAGNR